MTFTLNGAPVKTGGPEDRLLPWERVQDIAGISRTTAWRMQRTGDFPTPVTVSPGRVGWWESELTAWKSIRTSAKGLAPPARPRLPGMPRRASARPAPLEPTSFSVQQDLLIADAAGPPEPPKSKRGKAVNTAQSDFGF